MSEEKKQRLKEYQKKISFNEKVLIYMTIYSSVINRTIFNTPLPSV